MLFSKRSIAILFKTPVAPLATTSAAPQAVELSTLVSSRPRGASRTYSTTPVVVAAAARPRMTTRVSSALRFPAPQTPRGYASDKGKMELYSDEEGSVGAGIDDVAKSDAAFNGETDPHKAAKQVEQDVSRVPRFFSFAVRTGN